MAAQRGKDILIKRVPTGGGASVTVGGMRSKSLTLNKETVDVTDSDSTDQWRELLTGAGVKSLAISGSGVFKDTATEGLVLGDFVDDVLSTYEFVVPSLGTFSCLCDIPSLEYSGEYNGEVQHSMSFESAGVVAFTPAA